MEAKRFKANPADTEGAILMACTERPLKTEENHLAALILAAGFSSRMKKIKPLLPMAGQTIIERVIGLFRATNITNILVVLGYGAEQLIPVLNTQGVSHVINPDFRSGMFSSIVKGVAHLDDECRAFFVLPADMPFVRVETLQRLIEAFRETGKAVCRPRYRQRRGHPPLISAAMIPAVLAFKDPGGLRALLAAHEKDCVDVPCRDPGILIDLDTPEDYRKFRSPLRRLRPNPPTRAGAFLTGR
jgi:CTP:molybdopterin cytidylyltransferase MocA